MRLRDKKYGRTCLHYAILANKPHMVPLLVAKEQERSQRQSQRKDSLALFKRISDSMTGHSATDDENVPFIGESQRNAFVKLLT